MSVGWSGFAVVYALAAIAVGLWLLLGFVGAAALHTPGGRMAKKPRWGVIRPVEYARLPNRLLILGLLDERIASGVASHAENVFS
jgi:hypothetical protein